MVDPDGAICKPAPNVLKTLELDCVYVTPKHLGYMMDTHCPSCEEVQAVLVVVDEYREMEFIARQNGSDS